MNRSVSSQSNPESRSGDGFNSRTFAWLRSMKPSLALSRQLSVDSRDIGSSEQESSLDLLEEKGASSIPNENFPCRAMIFGPRLCRLLNCLLNDVLTASR